MKIPPLPPGRLSVKCEAYLTSIGVSMRGFVLGGSTDTSHLASLTNLGAFDAEGYCHFSDRPNYALEGRFKAVGYIHHGRGRGRWD